MRRTNQYTYVTEGCSRLSLQNEIYDVLCLIWMLIKNFFGIHIIMMSEECNVEWVGSLYE